MVVTMALGVGVVIAVTMALGVRVRVRSKRSSGLRSDGGAPEVESRPTSHLTRLIVRGNILTRHPWTLT